MCKCAFKLCEGIGLLIAVSLTEQMDRRTEGRHAQIVMVPRSSFEKEFEGCRGGPRRAKFEYGHRYKKTCVWSSLGC